MRFPIGCAVLLAGLAFATQAGAVNMCQTPKLTCATTMPVGGFCECTARGDTQDGTVVPRAAKHAKVNATAGGCGTQPNAPGCK